MKIKLAASFALLLFTVCPAAYPQSSTVNESVELRQSASADCSDTLSTTSEGCAQNEHSATREPGSIKSSKSAGRMTSAGSESATIGGKDEVSAQENAMPADSQTEFQQFVAATTGQQLPIFGASLFHNVPSTFSPSDLTPVTSGYVLGPEDELRVRIWGQVNYSGNLRVDRSGDIFLPQIGIVHVAGLQFSALDQQLRAAISRIYRNFNLSVDVGQIRSMQVYVTGEARRPGVYTVSSLSSLVDALFASGGPSPQGSLRHIQLNRDGKTIADFDLYALLIRGDKSQDVRLLPEDVLYIPAAGPQVAIMGSIRNPGIYELRGGETISDLNEMAGKTTAMASSARISMERVGKDQLRQAMEFGFDSKGLAAPLSDGDILRIYPILPVYQKTVTLRGNVANPGRFSWRQGMRLSDLIPDRTSLESRDYWWKRSNLGLPIPTFVEPTATQSTSTPSSSESGTNASIAAQVDQASAVKSNRNNVRLTTPEINWDYAVIERLDPDTLKTSLISFDLGKLVLDHDASQDLTLQPGDTITIFSQADIRVPLDRQTKYVDLEGEFVHSGVYSVMPGETLRDVVRRAGGFTPKAYLYGSEFTRESTRLLQQQRIDEYARTVSMQAERGTQSLVSSASGAADVSASRAAAQQLVARLSQIRATGRIVLQFQTKSSRLEDVPTISLENGDRFIVPSVPATVNVIGAVYDQNSFLYQHGRTVGRYLESAGGPNHNADRGHSFVIRADGSVVSRAADKGLWGNSFDQLRLNPGDTIIVPDKTFHSPALRGMVEWTQLFSQLALGTAAVNSF